MLPSNLPLLATHHRPTAITAILLKDCCKDQLEWGKGDILVLERFPRAGEKAPLLSIPTQGRVPILRTHAKSWGEQHIPVILA